MLESKSKDRNIAKTLRRQVISKYIESFRVFGAAWSGPRCHGEAKTPKRYAKIISHRVPLRLCHVLPTLGMGQVSFPIVGARCDVETKWNKSKHQITVGRNLSQHGNRKVMQDDVCRSSADPCSYYLISPCRGASPRAKKFMTVTLFQ